MTPRIASALCAASLLLLGACGGVVDPSTNKIELFSGVLQVESFRIHEVAVSKRGEFEIRMTALSPEPFLSVGLQWGPIVNGLCGTVYQESIVSYVNFPAIGGTVTPGDYCLAIFDNGSLTQDNTYSVRVSHP